MELLMKTDVYLDDHLVVGERFSDRTFSTAFKEGIWTLPDAEIGVWWKWNIHFVRANQLGDGMQVIVVYKRPRFTLSNIVDPSFLVAGMSVYEEYDEEKDVMQIYLYKHKKDTEELELLNKILETYQLTPRVDQRWNFVVINFPEHASPVINTVWDKRVFAQHLSFFLGLLLAYPSGGSILSQTKSLTTWKSTIPLVGSISSYEKRIADMFHTLQEHGLFVTVHQQTETIGSLLQITVTDWEILSMLRELLGGDNSWSREEFFETTLRSAVLNKKPEINLQHSVLKLITK